MGNYFLDKQYLVTSWLIFTYAHLSITHSRVNYEKGSSTSILLLFSVLIFLPCLKVSLLEIQTNHFFSLRFNANDFFQICTPFFYMNSFVPFLSVCIYQKVLNFNTNVSFFPSQNVYILQSV